MQLTSWDYNLDYSLTIYFLKPMNTNLKEKRNEVVMKVEGRHVMIF